MEILRFALHRPPFAVKFSILNVIDTDNGSQFQTDLAAAWSRGNQGDFNDATKYFDDAVFDSYPLHYGVQLQSLHAAFKTGKNWVLKNVRDEIRNKTNKTPVQLVADADFLKDRFRLENSVLLGKLVPEYAQPLALNGLVKCLRIIRVIECAALTDPEIDKAFSDGSFLRRKMLTIPVVTRRLERAFLFKRSAEHVDPRDMKGLQSLREKLSGIPDQTNLTREAFAQDELKLLAIYQLGFEPAGRLRDKVNGLISIGQNTIQQAETKRERADDLVALQNLYDKISLLPPSAFYTPLSNPPDPNEPVFGSVRADALKQTVACCRFFGHEVKLIPTLFQSHWG
ncbi:hypothetical protein RJJ37_05050 [Rhizobium redzepovicii]|uniref:Uncharacterized protein n=1 Tax=Rhizobium redzepovicii TaxID=2867518 RepID=A0AAW8NWG7_9HYPH|nr:hypothetical protein [Rhizobium redzepovicii]MDR9759007.1 hypothetical protein [Rhizobium redzepovicii]